MFSSKITSCSIRDSCPALETSPPARPNARGRALRYGQQSPASPPPPDECGHLRTTLVTSPPSHPVITELERPLNSIQLKDHVRQRKMLDPGEQKGLAPNNKARDRAGAETSPRLALVTATDGSANIHITEAWNSPRESREALGTHLTLQRAL